MGHPVAEIYVIEYFSMKIYFAPLFRSFRKQRIIFFLIIKIKQIQTFLRLGLTLFENRVYFKLRPDKVAILRLFDNTPPKPSLEYAFHHIRIISCT
jgi:hypothetical protein